MEIRGPGDQRPTPRSGTPPVPTPATPEAGGRSRGGGDSFEQARVEPDDVPFWLIRFSADRAAGRRFLDEKARRRAREAERAWIAAWVAALPALAPPPPELGGRAGLLAWQAVADALCAASEAPLEPPRVVWQPNLRAAAPLRGQYLFQAEGGLLQLRPGAPGTPAEWLATVAHETFHHAQHALVVALYRGSPELPPPFDALATYYRDARIAYQLPGPALSAAAHARQDLEIGAWAFGAAVARVRIG